MSCSSSTTGRLRRAGPDRDAIAGRRRPRSSSTPRRPLIRTQGAGEAQRDAEHRGPHRRVAGGGASAGPCPPTTADPAASPRAAAPRTSSSSSATRRSAFVGADLEARLDELGATTLVFCGALAAHALEASVRHAGDLGYQVFVVADACQATDAVDVDGRALQRRTCERCRGRIRAGRARRSSMSRLRSKPRRRPKRASDAVAART